MIERKLFRRVSYLWVCILLILPLSAAYGAGETALISAGMALPKFTLSGSDSKEVQAYLGLKGPGAFSLSEVSGKIVVIDIVNVL